jgi:hypothetical protein
VRTFAGGKEKWTSLKTKLLTVARNRMKDHVDPAERQRTTGNSSEAVGRLSFGEAITTYREQLQEAAIRPNTKAFREAGLKLVLRSWENVEGLNVRRITSKMVEEWLRRFKFGLEPNSPLLLSMNTVPIESPFHSIIGNRGRWNIPLKESSDGVVPYWSTHLEAALSEEIVPANHTTAFQNPEAITEMKGILRLYLKTTAQ